MARNIEQADAYILSSSSIAPKEESILGITCGGRVGNGGPHREIKKGVSPAPQNATGKLESSYVFGYDIGRLA
jgi:hypothetical protein